MDGPVREIDTSLRGILRGSDENDLFFATQEGIELAVITAGAGSDTVIGNSFSGSGIGVSIINLGGGEDFSSNTVIATGTTTGMLSVEIFGGNGEDTIIARGGLLGVQDVFFEGAAGNDTFDLENGTGTVKGDSGDGDLLILDGVISEYTFTQIGSNQSGTIVGATNGTDLIVEDIERFILNGQDFTFEELFVGNEPIEVSIADLFQAEGNFGSTSFVFNLTRSGDLSNSLRVDWDLELIDGQADDGDFVFGQAPNGQAVFGAGSANAEVLIQVNGDRDFEPDETFTVRLSNPSAGSLSDDTATGTIENDDEQNVEPVEVSIAGLFQEEGDSGATEFVFTVSRTGDPTEAVTVDWNLGLGAAPSADLDDLVSDAARSGQVTIAANETSTELVIEVQGDTDFEPNENLTVTLSNPSVGTLGNATATGIILNDDQEPQLPEVSIEATDANKEEGNDGANPFTFTVTRTGDNSGQTAVTWTAAPTFINPVDVSDFVAGTTFTDELIFEPGDISKEITLNVNGDLDFEEDEGFTVTLSNPINATLGQGRATGTIVNDDQEPEQGETISRKQINGQQYDGSELSDSYEATEAGIIRSTFETQGGNDSIISLSENAAFSAIEFTLINTEDGADTVIAESRESTKPTINFSEINTGADNDTVIAKNTFDSLGSVAIGDIVIINTGDGNDTIIAEAEGFPLQNSTLNTGAGNDTVELRGGNDGRDNGIGTINGGSGDQDLLILGGTSINYFYELEDSTELQGNISAGNFGTTGLEVTGVEFFQFANEPGITYTFDELFSRPAPGSIGDFVWNDLNGNGFQDEGEPGIANVNVILQEVGGGGTSAVTNANGFYEFDFVSSEREYQVLFTRPTGFEPTIFQADGGVSSDIDSDAQTTSNPFQQESPIFVLSSGEDNLSIDAGYIPIM